MSKIGASWDDRVTILLSEAESEALPLLARAFPDFRQVLGPRLSALLERGRKLELEAVTT